MNEIGLGVDGVDHVLVDAAAGSGSALGDGRQPVRMTLKSRRFVLKRKE